MKLKMNNDDKFDIDLSQLNVQIDNLDIWCKSELPSINSFNDFISTTHEFKNQQSGLGTDNFFVEYRMLVKGNYHDSGIITSQAGRQTYTIEDCIYSFPTEFIRWCYNNRVTLEIKESQKNANDYIGFGILIPISRINKLYRKYKEEQRLKLVRESLFKKK